jgi:hypothetical protein
MAIPNQSSHPASQREAPTPERTAAIALEAVAEAIARLRYGAIGLTVHDGRVVQLEVTERQRFT